jgi:cell division protein FtsL
VRKGIAGLQRTFSKQKTTIEKLLPEIALLKRQVRLLEDAHNKSMQNAVTHLGHRIAAMESARHAANQGAIAELEKVRRIHAVDYGPQWPSILITLLH